MTPRRLVAGLALVVVLAGACSSEDPPPAQGKASPDTVTGDAAPEDIDGVVAVEIDGAAHVSGSVDYDTYPPLGGDHFGVWHNCGFWTAPIPDELAVHSMEHGAVWIAFQPDLPDDEQQVVAEAAAANEKVLAAPYPGLRAPLVLTAWGRQLDLDGVDDPRFAAFIDTYVESVAPEPDAACSGAVDGETTTTAD